MLFKFLNDILYKKKGDLLRKPDDEAEFQPYIIQRWLSMYSPGIANLLNNTTNRLYNTFETKEDWYKTFSTILPRVSFKKIKYIKKVRVDKSKEDIEKDELIESVAQSLEISKREVRYYMDEFGIDFVKEKYNAREK